MLINCSSYLNFVMNDIQLAMIDGNCSNIYERVNYVSSYTICVFTCEVITSRQTVAMVKTKAVRVRRRLAMKQRMRMKMTARPNSMGRSLNVRAMKQALTRYMSAALSFAIIDLSIGNVKIAVNNGKYPQNTPMKNNNPDYICSIHYFITASSRHSITFKNTNHKGHTTSTIVVNN